MEPKSTQEAHPKLTANADGMRVNPLMQTLLVLPVPASAHVCRPHGAASGAGFAPLSSE